MGQITVVGLGAAGLEQLTKEAELELLSAERIYFRTGGHPAYDWLQSIGKNLICFDRLYLSSWQQPDDIYRFIADTLVNQAKDKAKVTYAVPGSPSILEETTRLLLSLGQKSGLTVRIIQGVSFIEETLAAINFDFTEGLQIVTPRCHLKHGLFSTHLGLLVCQIEARKTPSDAPRLDRTTAWLLAKYPPDHPVTMIWTDGASDNKTITKTCRLEDLARVYGTGKYFASIYLPPLTS